MKLKDSQLHAIELDGATYSFSGNILSQIVDLRDIEGDKWFISDMQDAVSMIMTVEAPYKYVEVIVKKKLQESGEFEEPVSVITHWKKRKGKNTTDIFFTALPTRLFYKYIDQVKEHEDSVILFPLFSVLYYVFKSIRSQDPVALIFQHNRYADCIIGTRKRVYYANRCVAFDTTEEQISALWDTVKADIKDVEREHRIHIARVFLLNWIDSKSEPEWEDIKECYYIEGEMIRFNKNTYHISFLKAVKSLFGFRGISPLYEKIFYYTKQWTPYLNVCFFAVCLLLLAGSGWYHKKVSTVDRGLLALEQNKARIQVNVEQDVFNLEYKEILSFVKDLSFSQKAPSYKTVINDISGALSSGMFINVLKINYAEDKMLVEIFGNVKAPFDKAYKGYHTLIDILKHKGHIIQESKLSTDISSSGFLVKSSKRIQ
ncbi:MAG: hypothetical protein SVW57_10035 [Thermodesulfobacteriota bacterium]|nr:hypothetical protein [Thermodesulfobacteriota bacterium]